MTQDILLSVPDIVPDHRIVMNKVMNELTFRFECDNCGKCKPTRHFYDLVCCSICDHQYRDGGFYISY
jgi:ribosomal protein L37AE/L43A